MVRESGYTRYSLVAIILHWLIAIGIFGMIVLGWVMLHGHLTMMAKFQLYQLHKSTGISILLLVVLRVLWRVLHRPPPLLIRMAQWERRSAGAMHYALYGLILFLPLSGWAMVSASPLNLPTVLFHTVPWPDLPIFSTLPHKDKAEAVLKQIHHLAAFTVLALALIHAAAALRHHFVLRDDTLRRMLPGRPPVSLKG